MGGGSSLAGFLARTAATVTAVNGSHVRRDENGGKGGGQELRGLTRPGGYELARLPVAASPHRCALRGRCSQSSAGTSISHLVLRKRRNEVPENRCSFHANCFSLALRTRA